MKIISKFKDFYDYKVAKYGMDEKLVYTRKTYCEYFESFVIDVYTGSDDRISEENFNKNLKDNVNLLKENNFHKILFIGEKLIHLFFTENKLYTHFDLKYKEDLSKYYSSGWWYYKEKNIYSNFVSHKEITFNDDKKYIINTTFKYDWLELLSYNRRRFLSNKNIDENDIFLNEPMILIEYIGRLNSKKGWINGTPIYKFTYNPYLSKLGVYIDEDFIWQSLVEFLSNKRSEKEISPEVSNENKILSKGFDLKTSFRPNMKKKHKGDI